jgi:hypothetical protein
MQAITRAEPRGRFEQSQQMLQRLSPAMGVKIDGQKALMVRRFDQITTVIGQNLGNCFREK